MDTYFVLEEHSMDNREVHTEDNLEADSRDIAVILAAADMHPLLEAVEE